MSAKLKRDYENNKAIAEATNLDPLAGHAGFMLINTPKQYINQTIDHAEGAYTGFRDGDGWKGVKNLTGLALDVAPLIKLGIPSGARVGEVVAERVTAEGAVWAQKTFNGAFSKEGIFLGETVDGIAGMLKNGTLSATDIPINVVSRNGQTFILNTRSSAALMKAGISRSDCVSVPKNQTV
jgi:hypothetical protein